MFKKSALAATVIAAAAAVLTPSPSSAFIPRPYYPTANEIPTSANVWDQSESLSRITEARGGDAGQQQRSRRTVTVFVFRGEVPTGFVNPRLDRKLDKKCGLTD